MSFIEGGFKDAPELHLKVVDHVFRDGDDAIEHRHLNTRPDPIDVPHNEMDIFYELCGDDWSHYDPVRNWIEDLTYWRTENDHFREINRLVLDVHAWVTGEHIPKNRILEITKMPPMTLIDQAFREHKKALKGTLCALPSSVTL